MVNLIRNNRIMSTKYPLLFFFFTTCLYAQYNYEPSPEHPFGLPNPNAPQQVLDFAPLIGECECTSLRRRADQSWADPVDMIWRFKYIMNGMAVQDETLKSDGSHAGSIRQYIADSTRWYVHYYNSGSPAIRLPVWEGNKNAEGSIVLYREQTAPNGMEGTYRITFSDIKAAGFKWLGEWVSKDETIVFPTWKINCSKAATREDYLEKQKIVKATQHFSEAYMRQDYDAIANAYTADGKIFPNNAAIIEGRAAIKSRWVLPDGSKVIHHEILPEEIRFVGDHAYDYGYYRGQTKTKSGKLIDFKGKYVVIWKKENDLWKMYLDIWNRVAEQ